MEVKEFEKLKKMPIIETKISKSQDGKYILHRTVITEIKPVAYYEAVLKDNGNEEVE